jgi:hypothetical protein
LPLDLEIPDETASRKIQDNNDKTDDVQLCLYKKGKEIEADNSQCKVLRDARDPLVEQRTIMQTLKM